MPLILINARNCTFTALSLLFIIGGGTQSYAQNQQNYQNALHQLAKSFVEKISPAYVVPDKEKQLSLIPDGVTLLFKPRVDRLIYTGDIYALKHQGDIFLSFIDVIEVLELSIDFDEDEGTGQGWFLREDWTFSIDINDNTVRSRNRKFNIQSKDILRDNGILFIRGSTIAEWFDFQFNYDIAEQYIEIISSYPLPAVAKDARRQRDNISKRQENRARLPRMAQAEKMLSLDAIETNLSTRYSRTQSGNAQRRNTATFSGQGQILNHNAYAIATFDNQESLNSIRTRINKQSEDPDLLGPLNARFYEFGDIAGVDIPLTGSNRRSIGFQVNNNPLVNSDFNTTDIEGDTLPNWDVELYRNGVLIGFQQVGTDGRYNFENTNLFAGDNNFEVVLYGPQGQIERESLSIPVNEELLRTQQGTYDISVQLEDEDTYQVNPAEDEDSGTVNLAARYNTFLGGNLAYLGLRSRSIGGERENFVTSGGSAVYGGTLYDLDLAVDDDANLAAGWGARRELQGWDVAFRGQWNTDEYRISDTENPTTLNISASAQRGFLLPNEMRLNALANTTYQKTADGATSQVSELGLSNQIRNFNISNQLRHETRSGFESDQDDVLRNNLSVRGLFNKVFVRGGFDYEIEPAAEVDRYFGQVNYRHDYRKNADLFVEHRPERDFSRGRLSLNYTNDYFRTSPFVEVNSDDALFAGMNVNFSLLNVPDKKYPEITSTRVLGRGLVNSFVYFDKNGNFTFDEGDEALPDVMVESLNTRKRAFTNESGYASLQALGTSRPTDIIIDESSLPDSFMISAREGVSVLPIAGQSYDIKFPVHLSGEIDGTLFLEKDGVTQPYTNKKVLLYPLDNPERAIIETQAMFDGFYLFSKVPPGRYLMTPARPANQTYIGNPYPQYIEIGYDGPVIANQNITLQNNAGYVHYNVEFLEGFNQSNSDISILYELSVDQSGKSELAELIKLLTFQKRAAPLLRTLQFARETETGQKIYTGNPKQLHETCQKLGTMGIECQITLNIANSKSI